jgi:transcriptional regulator with XRE-family HTH domain
MSTGLEQALAEGKNPGEFVRERCRELGISVAKFCRTAGLRDRTVYNWSSGRSSPRWHVLQKVQRALVALMSAQASQGRASA